MNRYLSSVPSMEPFNLFFISRRDRRECRGRIVVHNTNNSFIVFLPKFRRSPISIMLPCPLSLRPLRSLLETI